VRAAGSPPTETVTGSTGIRATAWRVLSVLGELSITLGVVLALFVVYQLIWTNVRADRLADATRSEVTRSWTTSPPDRRALEAPTVPVGDAFALAYIPRLRSSIWGTPIVQGVSAQALARGLGHYTSTALPGELGNFALAGHRATNGEPLRDIDTLQTGDLVVVETADQWFTYSLDRGQIVGPSDAWVLDSVPGSPAATPTQALITLTTCHPRWGSEQRWVWWGTLVEVTGKDGQPPAAVTNEA